MIILEKHKVGDIMNIRLRRKDYPHKVLFAGPHRVGKSSTLDRLEQLYLDRFERGTKYKWRYVGGPWPDDGEKKDSLIAMPQGELDALVARLQSQNPQEFARIRKLISDEKLATMEQLRSEGKVAFEYDNEVDTRHLVGKEGALRTDKQIVYISDDHNGAMAYRQYFTDPITILFYTSPQVIEQRSRGAHFPPEQIRARLHTFEREFALFRQNSGEYQFLMSIDTPPIDRSIVLEEAAKRQKEKEIDSVATRVVALIGEHERYWTQGMNYAAFHDTFVNHKANELTGSSLSDLEGRLRDGPVKLELDADVEKYQKKGHYVDQDTLGALANVLVVKYFFDNGRHSLLVKGMVPPWSGNKPVPENILLELIKERLGIPSQRNDVLEERSTTGKSSSLGLFMLDNGGLYRDGMMYSLGDQLVDPTHSSLNVGFYYNPVKGKQNFPRVTGYTLSDMQQLGLTNGERRVLRQV